MSKTTKKGLKVLGLKIQDLRNVEIVEVDFQGKTFIEINGDNGSAKTTLIDGIFGAIIGAKHFGKAPWRVISKDKNKAMMKVVIGNMERQIEIKRSITKKTDEKGNMRSGGSLVITDTNGESLGQAFLNGLLSEFTVNPLTFAKRAPKDQIEIVKQLGGIDTTEIEEAYQVAYEDRTMVNREVKRAEALVKSLVCFKVKPVNIGELLGEKEAILDFNNDQKDIQRTVDDQVSEVGELESDVENLDVEIKRLSDTLAGRKNLRKETAADHVKAKKVLEELPKPKDEKSTKEIDEKVVAAHDINKRADQYKEFQKVSIERAVSWQESQELTDKLKDLEAEKKQMILDSKLPFKNIEFDDEVGILINEIPFSQKSSAEQLRISTRIGMEMHPDLRILFIEEGSLLDEESYSVIREMAYKHDYQVLVESVGERPGGDQIVLRAGSVVSAFERTETVSQKVSRMDKEL